MQGASGYLLIKVVEEGYEFFANRELITVFSAPNYCGEFDNAGAILTVEESLLCSFQILKPTNKPKPNALLGGIRAGMFPFQKMMTTGFGMS